MTATKKITNEMIEKTNVISKLPKMKEMYTKARIDMDKGTFYYFAGSDWRGYIEIDLDFEANNIKDLMVKLDKIKWDYYDGISDLYNEMISDYKSDTEDTKKFFAGRNVDVSTYEKFEESIIEALYNDFYTYAGVLGAIELASYELLQEESDEEKIEKMNAKDIIDYCWCDEYWCDADGNKLTIDYKPNDVKGFYNQQCQLLNIDTTDIDSLDIPESDNGMLDRLFSGEKLSEENTKQVYIITKNELKAERINNRWNSIKDYCKSVYTRYLMKGKSFLIDYLKDCECQITMDRFVECMRNYMKVFSIKVPEYDNLYFRFKLNDIR